MSPVPFSEVDLASRRPVWQALSELFLDSDTSASGPSRVEILSRSPYPTSELRTILLEEVYPVCKHNLNSVAGVWAGFDMAWLEHSVVKRRKASLRTLDLALFNWPPAWLRREWQALESAITARRATGSRNEA